MRKIFARRHLFLSKRRRHFSLAALALGTFVVASGALLCVWWFTLPEDVDIYQRGAPRTWSKLDLERREIGKRVRVQTSFVRLSDIPSDVQFAVIVGEDVGFTGHGPWDFEAIQEAFKEWWDEEDEPLRGASTITQQLAKNLFLSGERSMLRKVREARYAYWLERRLGKRRVLELYLNIIELGEGIFGMDAAARHYFGTGIGSATREQAALLAATIPSPIAHNPNTKTRAFTRRHDVIVARMSHYEGMRKYLVGL